MAWIAPKFHSNIPRDGPMLQYFFEGAAAHTLRTMVHGMYRVHFFHFWFLGIYKKLARGIFLQLYPNYPQGMPDMWIIFEPY